MLEDCKKGKIDLIVVKDVSRFARNLVDCQNSLEFLQNLDPPVGVYFENNGINTLDTTGKVVIELLAMFAELENELKRKQKAFRRKCRTQNK